MATFNLTKTELVAAGTASITCTPTAYFALANYTDWNQVGRAEWTATAGDAVTVTSFVTVTASAITCTGTDQLACYLRARLRDVTTGGDVWAGTQTQMFFRRIGTVNYNELTQQLSFNSTFLPRHDLLIPGHSYALYFEVKKERVVGTPTLTLNIDDASCYADSALLNL